MNDFEQIFKVLNHLHAKRIMHHDFKSKIFLIELESYFKIVIIDFDLINVVIDNAWLKIFCDSLKYITSKMFFDLSKNHDFLIDVWFMNVIDIEWIYNISTHSNVFTSKKQKRKILFKIWSEWITIWTENLLDKLNDENENENQLINMFFHMIQFKVDKRWSAKKCLMQDLNTDLLKKKKINDFIVCANYRMNLTIESTTLTSSSSSIKASSLQSRINLDVITILKNLWGINDFKKWSSIKF